MMYVFITLTYDLYTDQNTTLNFINIYNHLSMKNGQKLRKQLHKGKKQQILSSLGFVPEWLDIQPGLESMKCILGFLNKPDEIQIRLSLQGPLLEF